MSEELENSLQQAVETYLNDRLRAINEQVSRLQNEVGEALTRLRENAGSQSLEGTALSAAIFAHLQSARGQRLTGATTPTAQASDAGAIRRAVEAIQQQQSQTDILKALLTGAVQFAERAALFVIKNEQAIGWRSCRAGDAENLEMIGGVSLPMTSQTTVTQAATSGVTQSAEGPSSENQLLIDQLGGHPQIITAIPLSARGKVVAVLYADAARAGAINSDALEILARMGAMTVSLPTNQRAAQVPVEQREVPHQAEASSEATQREVAEAPPTYASEMSPVTERGIQAEAPPTYTPEMSPVTERGFQAELPPTYVPDVSSVTAETERGIQAEAPPTYMPEVELQPETVSAEAVTESIPEHVSETETPPVETAPMAAPEPPAPEVTQETSPLPATQHVTPPPTPSRFISDYVTPLGSTRRGISEPELPIEVGEEERRLHNDARRFARLLVSEIKLYNEPKVKEGRTNNDLYDRLREDIDRSRQMYDKRVAAPVAARHDYFHQELVNTLAEGDPNKLGSNYPGSATVSA